MSVYLRKYNVTLDGSTAGSLKIRVPLVRRDETAYLASGDWTPAAGDVKVSKDFGAEANIGTLPTFSNDAWEFVLSATELSAKNVTVRVNDAAVELFSFTVETFGHASAMWPLNFGDSVRMGMTALPDAAAQAAGGLFTRGTGAGQINQDADGQIDVNVHRWLTGTPNALVSGRVDSRPGAIANGILAAATFASDFWTTILSTLGLSTGNLDTQLGDIPNNTEFNARTLATADYATAANQTTLLGRLTASRAGYLDNLNVGGLVASQADIDNLNQAASRWIILQTVGAYERPESGSTVYTVEMRTYDGDGDPVAADSTPTLAVTGQTTGDLSANLGAATNPSTGVYRWTYTVASDATLEPIRFDGSATIGGTARTMSVPTQTTDAVSVDFSAADRAKLEAVFDKLPSADFLLGGSSSDGSGYATPTHVSTAESNIRGADSDTLKTLSDQADGIATNASTAATQSTGANTKAAAIQAKTDALPASPAAVGSAMTLTAGERTSIASQVDTTLSGTHGAGSWEGGGGSLSGPYVLTVTVTDADTDEPIEGALVRVWLNSDTETKQANVSGQTTHALTDGLWNYAVDRYGFDSVVGTKEIDGANAALAVELPPHSIPASNPGYITLYVHALQVNGAGNGYEDAGAGIEFHLQVTDSDQEGFSVPSTVLEATTGANSKAAFINIPRSSRYDVWAGDSTHRKKSDRTPDSGTEDTLPFIIGGSA